MILLAIFGAIVALAAFALAINALAWMLARLVLWIARKLS